jgi:hypothetical protein
MSADELRRRVVGRLTDQRDRLVEAATNVRFRPSSGSGPNHCPASTAEEIALYTVEIQAAIRSMNVAIDEVQDTYRRMIQPDDDKKPEQVKRNMYS